LISTLEPILAIKPVVLSLIGKVILELSTSKVPETVKFCFDNKLGAYEYVKLR